MRYDRDTIERIEQAADIVQIISEHGVDLRPHGGVYKGLCPFHHEKTPSFTVNPQRQFYYCFGCHAGGGVLKFLTDYDKLSFPEAIQELAQRYSIPLQQTTSQESSTEKPYFQCCQAANLFFHEQLLQQSLGDPGRRYLTQRTFLPESWKRFSLGYAPDQWQALYHVLKQQKFHDALLQETGLVKQSESGRSYDFFRGRVIFPIRDLRGRCVAFGGRTLKADEPPKYLNSPESAYYQKNQVLYGLYEGLSVIKRSRTILVVEGYLDVIRLHEHGFENAAAPCGTALTEKHLQLIQRHADHIQLLFDGDTAGQKAAYKSCELLLNTNLNASIITLPQGEDPDSFLQTYGKEALQAYLQKGMPSLEFLMQQTLARFPSTSQGILKAVEELLPKVHQISKEALRHMTLLQIAQRVRLPEKTILDLSETLISRKNHAKVEDFKNMPLQEEDLHERRVLEILLIERHQQEFLAKTLESHEFHVPHYRRLYEALLAVPKDAFQQCPIENFQAALPDLYPTLLQIYMGEFPQDHLEKQLKTALYRIKSRNLKQQFQQSLVNATDDQILAAGVTFRKTQNSLYQQLQVFADDVAL